MIPLLVVLDLFSLVLMSSTFYCINLDLHLLCPRVPTENFQWGGQEEGLRSRQQKIEEEIRTGKGKRENGEKMRKTRECERCKMGMETTRQRDSLRLR